MGRNPLTAAYRFILQVQNKKMYYFHLFTYYLPSLELQKNSRLWLYMKLQNI